METCVQVLSLASDLTATPNDLKLFPLGFISSEKGDFIVDQESFQMMKENMERRAIDIVIDYEHQTLKDLQAPASGWIKELVLKSDGIYGRVEWTEKARNYLQNKEYRYLSPVVLVRKQDRKVSQLHSVALTNTPAINGMNPIVNSASLPTVSDPQLDDEKRKICRLLNISEAEYAKYWMRGNTDESKRTF